MLHEKHEFQYNCELLSKREGQALGAMISKIHNMKQCGFKTFQKLYTSVLCYTLF